MLAPSDCSSVEMVQLHHCPCDFGEYIYFAYPYLDV
jgi:hypothetical protein